jgi:hypothetical protein
LALVRGLSALLAFAFGVLVMPLLHEVGHRPDHVHGPDGRVYLLSGGEGQRHAHAGGHAHDDAKLPATEASEQHRDAPDPDHGNGSLLHVGVAMLAPALFVVPPLAELAESRAPLPRVSVHEGRSGQRLVQARGPPA